MAFLKSVERSLKQLAVRIIGSVVQGEKRFDNLHGVQDTVKRILVLRLEQKVGNVVMTTFFPRALKDIYPGAEVDILAHESVAPIWEGNQFIGRKYIFSHKKHLGNPFLLLKLLSGLRRKKYDIVFDCSNPGSFSVSNGMLAWFTGAPYRIGFRRGESERFLNATVYPDHSKHYIVMMHDLLGILDVDAKSYRPEIVISDDEISAARDTLRGLHLQDTGKLVTFWIGAADKKEWPLENFLKLADDLKQSPGTDVLILCGPAEKEAFKRLSSEKTVPVLYIDDLRKLAAIIGRSALFVSGDAGPMHLAAAVDTCTVGIFLQDNDRVYGYDDGKRHRIVKLIRDRDDIREVAETCRQVLQAAAPRKAAASHE